MVRSLVHRLVTVTAVACLACLLAGAARSAGIGGAGTPGFGVSPRPIPHGAPRAYFSLSLAAGQSARDAVIVTNSSAVRETLKLSPSIGTTAPASGIAFRGYFKPCAGTGCWITGLPATLTLAPHAAKTVPFTVTVPAGSPHRQYLAGITVQPAGNPAPTTLGSRGATRVQAVIVHQVTVGVAVTVGKLASLATRIQVASVSSTAIGAMPRLLIHERNVGQTFVHATGEATCKVDVREARYAVGSDTVLPGEGAVLVVNAQGLPPGKRISCTVRLEAEHGSSASRTESVAVPSIVPVKIVHTGPGVYSTLPKPAGTPTWVYALIGAVAVLVLALLAVLIVLLHHRRPAAA